MHPNPVFRFTTEKKPVMAEEVSRMKDEEVEISKKTNNNSNMELENIFFKWFQRVYRSMLQKERWNDQRTITRNMLEKLQSEAGKRATELSFIYICVLKSRVKLICFPDKNNENEDGTLVGLNTCIENNGGFKEVPTNEKRFVGATDKNGIETLDVSGVEIPRKTSVEQGEVGAARHGQFYNLNPSNMERGSVGTSNRDKQNYNRQQTEVERMFHNQERTERRVGVREGRIGAFARFALPSQRRTQRRAARIRARRVGDGQLREMEMVFDSIGRRCDLEMGVYPLHDFVDASNRETTHNFLDWFRELEERENDVR